MASFSIKLMSLVRKVIRNQKKMDKKLDKLLERQNKINITEDELEEIERSLEGD